MLHVVYICGDKTPKMPRANEYVLHHVIPWYNHIMLLFISVNRWGKLLFISVNRWGKLHWDLEKTEKYIRKKKSHLNTLTT